VPSPITPGRDPPVAFSSVRLSSAMASLTGRSSHAPDGYPAAAPG